MRNTTSNMEDTPKNSNGHGPWMLVERRSRRLSRMIRRSSSQDLGPTNTSWFQALETLAEEEGLQVPGQQALDQIRPTKESGLGLAISHKGVGLVELGLKEEVGITNLNIRHSRLGIKNGSTRGLGQHKPAEREGLIDVTKERIGRDGLERVSSAKGSLKSLASRARKEEDTDQVHSTDVLTDGTTFLGLMRTSMGEQRRSIIKGHTHNTMFVGEWREEVARVRHHMEVATEASSYPNQCLSFDRLQEVMMTITEGIIDSSRHSIVAFQKKICPEPLKGSKAGRFGVMRVRSTPRVSRAGGGKYNGKNKKLNKTFREKGNPLKAFSPNQ
ncbi:hypothetical protein GOBAR_AA00219 [Gossypium barbadense]|uniref:Uncharacterized protein n=1 Tax=Gossypium barbadense TaxID=3634 RepID=A0A2P5YXK3_GOSBA|nr:hypothetical protein GOBAR_AA00219 [Gossypium barbadense]